MVRYEDELPEKLAMTKMSESPGRESINSAIDSLMTEIDRLESRLSKLQDLLNPVLVPMPLPPTDNNASDVEPDMSSTRHGILSAAKQIRTINRRIHEIIDAVDF